MMVDTEHSSDNNGADPAFTNYTHSHIARIIVMMMIITVMMVMIIIVVMMIIVMMMMIVVMMMTIVMMMIKIIKSFAGKSGRQIVGKYGERNIVKSQSHFF